MTVKEALKMKKYIKTNIKMEIQLFLQIQDSK